MEFVTRKITDAVARIALGEDLVLNLGNLDALRDWGYADEYIEGMWRMLQADAPDTFVFATGRTASVRDFTTMAFKSAGMEIAWRGEGDDEHAIWEGAGRQVVRIDPEFRRPAEVEFLLGDFSKAERTLGWRPKVGLEELCAMMVDADIGRHRNTINPKSPSLADWSSRKTRRFATAVHESAVTLRSASA